VATGERDDRLLPMTLAHLDEVLHVEQRSYAFPWTRGNFVDSLAACHWMRVIRDGNGALAAYIVAMPGVDEMHLLNITVEPGARRRGLATRLLVALEAECIRRDAKTLWLEVRPGNAEALSLYLARGFVEVARRRGYYPAARGAREDAIVMSRSLRGETQDAPPRDDTDAARSRPTTPGAPT
jgi:ribosomal-protein-alanine N-acetyltransferase